MLISLLEVTHHGIVYIVRVVVCFELDMFSGYAYITTLATST